MGRKLLLLTAAGTLTWLWTALAGPRLVVSEPSLDFGQLTNVAAVAHTFVLRNIGDADAAIQRVELGCGSCLSATLATNVVPAGGETPLTCEMNLRSVRGNVARSVKVVAGKETLTLTLAADVAVAYQPPAREVLPSELVFEAKAEPQTRIVWLRQHGAQPVALLDVIAPSENFRCEVDPDPSTPSYRVYVTAHDLPAGQGGELVLKMANESQLTVPLKVKP